jgi:peptidoglycan/LPS O-acetylase OafA/YrhL
MEPATFQLGYRRWLDGLRGVAILLVLAYHFQLMPGGLFGVDLFFVLSGFLITTLLVEEWQRRGSISLRLFYLRRALRLAPAFVTVLALALAYTLLFRPTELNPYCREMLVSACYVANWPALHNTPMATLGHTWSLSVEEQFYLVWPIFLYGMLKLGLSPRTMILVVCAGILCSASLRGALYYASPSEGQPWVDAVYRLYMGSDTRADAVLVGCLVGLCATWELIPRSQLWRDVNRIGALASVAGLTYIIWRYRMHHAECYYGVFTLIALLVAVILIRLLSAPWRLASGLLESRVLAGFGRLSYGLYLYHMPIIKWLGPSPLGWSADTALVAGVSLAAAVASYYAIERPCLRLKSRLQSPGAHAPAAGVLPTAATLRLTSAV